MTDAIELSDTDDFADVQVITIAQWLKEKAYEKAWKLCDTPHNVEPIAQDLLKTEFTSAQEFVKITDDGIQVGLNVSEINDKAIDKAIELMAQVESLQTNNTYTFGERT